MKNKTSGRIFNNPVQPCQSSNTLGAERSAGNYLLPSRVTGSPRTKLGNRGRFHSLSLLTLLLSFVVLAGCAPITPRLDARFGDAVGIAKAQQTMNPEASLNTDAVQGVDGQAGDAIFDNYRNSFRSPKPPIRGVLNLGTGSIQGSSGN